MVDFCAGWFVFCVLVCGCCGLLCVFIIVLIIIFDVIASRYIVA